MKANRKNFLNDIKVLKENHRTLKEFAEEKYVDNQGIANIHIYTDEQKMFNQLTNPSSPEISNEIFDFIDTESYYIPAEYPIKVVIHSSSDLDEVYIEKKLKEHYLKLLADKEDDLKKNKIISIILFAIGILFLSTYFVLANLPTTKDLFNEIFSIVGSFSIWESVDYFLLNRSAIKIDYFNIAQLALIKVNVSDNEEK